MNPHVTERDRSIGNILELSNYVSIRQHGLPQAHKRQPTLPEVTELVRLAAWRWLTGHVH